LPKASTGLRNLSVRSEDYSEDYSEDVMPIIKITDYDTTDEVVKRRYDDQIRKHGRITNMKRTLLNHPQAFDVYMQWYDLRDSLTSFISEDAATYFAYAISTGNDCLICATFFRKILIDAGKNPDELQLTENEQLLVDFGRAIAQNPHNVSDAIYEKLRALYNDQQITLLIAFAGIMVATNLFNTVAQVDLDEVLYEYREPKAE
jgi:alkylhydroperoxidase family enzyme